MVKGIILIAKIWEPEIDSEGLFQKKKILVMLIKNKAIFIFSCSCISRYTFQTQLVQYPANTTVI